MALINFILTIKNMRTLLLNLISSSRTTIGTLLLARSVMCFPVTVKTNIAGVFIETKQTTYIVPWFGSVTQYPPFDFDLRLTRKA